MPRSRDYGVVRDHGDGGRRRLRRGAGGLARRHAQRPRVTWPAIRNVLPAAVAYDVLLCPFVLYAVAAALRLAGARGERRRAGWSASQARTPVPGANQGAIRQLVGGDVLRLRLSDRDKGSGAVAGLRGPGAGGRRPGVSPGSSWAGRVRRARRPPTGTGPARARPGSDSAAGAGRACSAARCSAAPAPAAPRCAARVWAVQGLGVWAVPCSAARAWAGPCSAARCSAAPPLHWAAVPRSATRRPRSAGRLPSGGRRPSAGRRPSGTGAT